MFVAYVVGFIFLFLAASEIFKNQFFQKFGVQRSAKVTMLEKYVTKPQFVHFVLIGLPFVLFAFGFGL